jgi:glycosyltransferase involved in cell wall biosynthesis
MSETISIVIPAYNEGKTIKQIVGKVLKIKFEPLLKKEIIIVNDFSSDDTTNIVKRLQIKNKNIKLINNTKNLGKSQSVKKGILESVGDFIVIQDADSEYNPEDLVKMFRELSTDNLDVCYGNRFGRNNGMIYPKNFYGNLLLSLISNLFTINSIKVYIPDMEVCYKMCKGDILRNLAKNIESKSNFGFEPEITAKLSRYKKNDGKSLSFGTIPISYNPRTYKEGKKMKAFSDGFKALVEIIKFNMF